MTDVKSTVRMSTQEVKYARKLAFSQFVMGLEQGENWVCCNCVYTDARDCHKHVAKEHNDVIDEAASNILKHGSQDAKWHRLQHVIEHQDPGVGDNDEKSLLPSELSDADVFPWLPKEVSCKISSTHPWQVLLFYKYRHIANIRHVHIWQKVLCDRLHLRGKVRISHEGINITVCGPQTITRVYIDAVKSHPLFSDMTDKDFKMSDGDCNTFPSLKIGVHNEAVPMAIQPDQCPFQDGGDHVTPDEFHKVLERHLRGEEEDAVFVDCRNFYESRVGKFCGAMTPDIRKFSYWPEYVERNAHLFRNKRVYMYCTGGIRCERGSAYIRRQGLTDKVFQLEGGIHRYLEQFPDGYFHGNLFVFDERYALRVNKHVIASCCYCHQPWDAYAPCSSRHCHQLVLSCDACRSGGLTACCPTCARNAAPSGNVITSCDITSSYDVEDLPRGVKEECECTQTRERIPLEAAQQTFIPEAEGSSPHIARENAHDTGEARSHQI